MSSRVESLAARVLAGNGFVALIALGIVALAAAATLRVCTTGISLAAGVQSLRLTPFEPLNRDLDLPAGQADAEHFTEIDGGSFGCGAIDAAKGLRLKGDLRLAGLDVGTPGNFELRMDGPARLEIVLNGEGSILLGASPDIELTDPGGRPLCKPDRSLSRGTLRLIFAGGGTPARLALALPASSASARPLLRDVRLSGIDFIEPDSDQSPARRPVFRSTIRDGKVRLLDLGRDIDLRDGDPLRLETIKNAWVGKISLDGAVLRIDMIASVGAPILGPEGFSRNLAPTWLAYLTANDAAKDTGLWSGVVATLAALWGARKWARRKKRV